MGHSFYDQYGINGVAISDAARVFSSVLGVPMRERNSYHWGIYYSYSDYSFYKLRGVSESFDLHENLNQIDNEFDWAEYKSYSLIFCLHTYKNPDVYKEIILSGFPNAVFLERTIIKKED